MPSVPSLCSLSQSLLTPINCQILSLSRLQSKKKNQHTKRMFHPRTPISCITQGIWFFEVGMSQPLVPQALQLPQTVNCLF